MSVNGGKRISLDSGPTVSLGYLLLYRQAGMGSLWSFIGKPKNRQILSWIGGGVVAVVVGAWAVVTYVWPAHEPGKPACVQQGVLVGGSVSGSTVSNNVTGSSVSGPCVETSQRK